MNDDVKQLAERFKLNQVQQIEADPQLLTLRYSPDGKFLVAAGYDARVRRWDATKDELPELAPIVGHQGWAQAICFSADSSTVFTGDSWGQLRASTLGEAEPKTKWQHDAAHASWLRDAAMSPDGKSLATCGADHVVRIWSAEDGKKQWELRGENDDLYVVCFSPDGQQVLAGDRLGKVYVWNLATQQVARTFDASVLYKLDRIQDVGGVRTIAFDKSGTWLAIGGMKPKNGATIQGVPALLLFDWKSGELKHTHEIGGTNDCDLMGVHLHDDGFFVAVANGGPGAGKIVLQRYGDEQPFITDTRYANVQSLAWHPSGKRFAISGTNNGSNGNGRSLDKDGKYPGNRSPITVFAVDELAS